MKMHIKLNNLRDEIHTVKLIELFDHDVICDNRIDEAPCLAHMVL